MSGVREAMIIAGGKGTRLRPLTLTTPKPLLPLCGEPFLSGVIRSLATIGVERVLLVVGAVTEPFESLRDDAAAVGVVVEIVPEPTPLDTAGGVRAALDQVTGTFLVLNGDILTGLDLTDLVAQHRSSGAAATLALTRVEDTSSFGVCVLDGQRIVDFVEKPEPGSLPGQDAVNAGTYVLEPEAMRRFAPGSLSFERTVFPELVAAGEHVHGVVSAAVWADLGTPERFLDGHRLVMDGAVPWPVTVEPLHDTASARRRSDIEVAASATIDGPVLLLPGAHVGTNARVGPYVVVGHGSRIGDGAQLRDTILFDGVEVGARARATGCLVGHRAIIGPGVELDPGSVLGDAVTMGGHAVQSPA
jgi:mannose-1-phosphate guanylyltransferase